MEYHPGDVLWLKSGSPPMTVDDADEESGSYLMVWVDRGFRPTERRYQEHVLTNVCPFQEDVMEDPETCGREGCPRCGGELCTDEEAENN